MSSRFWWTVGALLFAVGESGAVYRPPDGGATWTP
ncbi:photosystem II stability/assembly factor-like uncharacterized protein [Deinococcus humi]|uniref:Photosystem II stability/assembly factor-like uncharacterized protein n=1 Tax=Deinococcus humi TaxID=662880 RepID=A0A7W8JZQ6_9DEIO|nr:photosystem II stability/assembly factor-like uncharacterized protein [Deinococcus humi]